MITPPFSQEAEEALLGSLIIDPDGIFEVCNIVKQNDFYHGQFALIYGAMLSLMERGVPCDFLTIQESLGDKLQTIGGDGTLIDLINSCPTSVNVAHYAKIVSDKSTRRKMIRAAARVTEFAVDETIGIDDALAGGEGAFLEVHENRPNSRAASGKQLSNDWLDWYTERQARGNVVTGIPTGLTDLDKLLDGFIAPNLYVLAGRAGMGKSAVAISMLSHIVLDRHKRVMLFSPEMTGRQITSRLLAHRGGVSLNELRTGVANVGNISHILQEIADSRLVVDPYESITPSMVRARATREHVREPLDLIVVDHLHRMSPDTEKSQRHLELGDMVRSLVNTGKMLNVPILLLAQLSRGVESRSDKRPMMSDLRESGAIEEEAYAIMLLYRDEYYNKEMSDRPAVLEIELAKHRDGELATLDFFFDGRCAAVRDLQRPF
jgi:replicative DNA helicase